MMLFSDIFTELGMGIDKQLIDVIEDRPPNDISTANEIFLSRHSIDFNNLTIFTENSNIREYYLYIASKENISPIAIVLNDISFITSISAHLKLIFEDILNPLSLSKMVFINGNSSYSKNKSMCLHKKRLSELYNTIRCPFEHYQHRKAIFTIKLLLEGYIRNIAKTIDSLIPVVLIEECYNFYFSKQTVDQDLLDHLMSTPPFNVNNTNRYNFHWDRIQQEKV